MDPLKGKQNRIPKQTKQKILLVKINPAPHF